MRIAPNPRRGGRRTQSAPMAEINIIPLVDVILVLLIIFMVTTAFVKETGLNLKLPVAKTAGAGSGTGVSRDLVIALGKGGEITLDRAPATEAQVESAMRERVKSNRQTRVVIKGDAGVAYARVVRLMDLARQSGLNSVSLGTRPPEESIAAR